MATGTIQPSPPQPQQTPTYSSPPITIVLTIILLVFFLVCFFSIYFCRCFMHNILYARHLRHSPAGSPVDATTLPVNNNTRGRGLDPSIIQSYPTFTYSSVKSYRKEKYGLECAICLVEFDDSEVLRLLEPCCHVFHQECIDLWLESHNTCPVCRRNLDSPIQSPVKAPNENSTSDDETSIQLHELSVDSFCITIKDDQDHETRASDNGQKVTSTVVNQPPNDEVDKFYRSNSTGHSIGRNREEEEGQDHDRFTLRLPPHVQSNIIRKHCSSKSCTTFGEHKFKSITEESGPVNISRLSAGDTNGV